MTLINEFWFLTTGPVDLDDYLNPISMGETIGYHIYLEIIIFTFFHIFDT